MTALEEWVRIQRDRYYIGQMPEDQQKLLESIPGWEWGARSITRQDNIQPHEERLIGSSELAKRLGISPSSLKRLKDCDLPKPVKVGKRLIRWRLSDVIYYVNNL